jgi:transcription elongation factor SPT5
MVLNKKFKFKFKLQVDYVEPSQNVVHVKLIPRIDYNQPRGIMRTSSTDQKKRKRRPPQKLLDVDQIR